MHRLFHTVVVCGAGLTALQCGGKAIVDGESDDGAGGSSGGAASGGTGTSAGTGGAAPSTGGAGPASGGTGVGGTVTASGGASAGGKGGAFGTAGTTGKGGFAGKGGTSGVGGSVPMGGAPWEGSEQWTCVAEAACGWTSIDRQTCYVDLGRPKSADDCGEGEIFACISGRGLDSQLPVTVNCECIPLPPDPVICPCPPVMAACDMQAWEQPEECAETGTSTCACAVTCILK